MAQYASFEDPRLVDVSRQRRMAEMLRQQSAEPFTQQTAGGYVVPIAPTSGLAKMLRAYSAGEYDRQAGDAERQVYEGRQNALSEALRGGPPEGIRHPDYVEPSIGKRLQASGDPYWQQQALPLIASERQRAQEAEQARALAEYKITAEAAQRATQNEWEAGQSAADNAARIEAARIRAQGAAASGAGMPATVQEWQYFNSLSPEDQSRFLTMKRANGYVNLGGTQVQFDPAQPGVPVSTQEVTLKPGELPETKAAQAAAVANAESTAKRAATQFGTDELLSQAEGLLTGEQLPTGSGLGAATDAVAGVVGMTPAGAEQADQLEIIAGNLVSKVPRMEGPQSNYDVQNYKAMAGDLGNRKLPVKRRLAALQTLKALNEKYAILNQREAVSNGTAPVPTIGNGWSIQPVN